MDKRNKICVSLLFYAAFLSYNYVFLFQDAILLSTWFA